MFEKLAQVGVLGAVAVAVVGTFVFLTVTSVLDVPGVREFDSETRKTLIGTTITMAAGLGGAAAAKFGGGSNSNSQ
jgi:hypothetical protein